MIAKFSLGALAALGLASLAVLPALAQATAPASRKAAPKPAAPAVVATFDAVHDGQLAAGKSVDFPILLLPETAIQNKSGGKVTYYALAVRKNGPYLKAVEALVTELKGPGAEAFREIPGVVGDDKRYRQLIGALDDLVKRALDVKLGPEEAIAVELPGFDALAGAYDWETVSDPKARPSWLTPLEPIVPFRSEYAFSIDAAGVRREIINMALAEPPNLEQSLPQMTLSPLFKFTNQVDLDNYNAAVELHNAELRRRRVYVVERTQADIQLALDRLEFRLGQPEETLSASVIAPPSLAKETFSRIYNGKTPGAYVRERGKPEASLARRALSSTAVQICSYPTGASVRLNGSEVGVTPYIARGLPAASKLALVIAKAGLPPREASETVPMKPSGIKRFDYSLVTAKPRLLSVEEGKRLFDPGFRPAQPFTLAIAVPAPLPNAKDKKDKEAAKGVAKYVDALRKAAADAKSVFPAWFRAVDGGDADVMIELTPIQPSERKGKYDTTSTHRVRLRLSGDAADGGIAEDVKPASSFGDGAPEKMLSRAVERLRSERWQRTLGIP
jgi:hypothetical protein